MTQLARLLAATVLALWPVWAFASERMALVIGIADYDNITKLRNTENDARLIGQTLEDIGFDVRQLVGPGKAELEAALEVFAFDSQVADVALIYFAGHGVELDGVNYLIPRDVAPRSEDDIKTQSVTLAEMLATVDDARKIRIVILDACRDNPFSDEVSQSVAPAGSTTAAQASPAAADGGGLAPAEPDPDTLVVFAARDGQVAYDGAGNNSPFAEALATAFQEPGSEIGLMFRKVRDLVRTKTDNLQQSYTYGSLSSEQVYFLPPETAPGLPTASTLTAGLGFDDVEQLIASGTRSARALQEGGADDSLASRDLKMAAKILLDPADPKTFDPERALQLLQLAADVGDAEAMWELARFYEKGIHVPVDEARALSLFRQAADLGFDKALNDLGFMYAQGLLGLAADQTRAFQLFEAAAKERHPQALFNFAVLIDQGVVPGRGPDQAAGYLFDALRTGQKDVLNLLCARPEMFSRETRAGLQEVMREYGFYGGAIDASFGQGTTRGIALAYGTPEEEITQAAIATCDFD